jgi:hypothetical protein
VQRFRRSRWKHARNAADAEWLAARRAEVTRVVEARTLGVAGVELGIRGVVEHLVHVRRGDVGQKIRGKRRDGGAVSFKLVESRLPDVVFIA